MKDEKLMFCNFKKKMKRFIVLLIAMVLIIQFAQTVYCSERRKHSRKTKHPSLESFECNHSNSQEIIHQYHKSAHRKHHHHRKHPKHVHKIKKIKKRREEKPKETKPCKDETLPSHPRCFFVSYQIKSKQEAILKHYFATNPSFQ